MNEDEAFIRAIVDSPGDDTPRLVYADWLDDRADPRGPYLRAELAWAQAPSTKVLRAAKKLAKQLDPEWAARVSRPPLGVCCDHLARPLAESTEPAVTPDELDEAAGALRVTLPDQLRAFLLNYPPGQVGCGTLARPAAEAGNQFFIGDFVCYVDPDYQDGWASRELVEESMHAWHEYGLGKRFVYLASSFADDGKYFVSCRGRDRGSVHLMDGEEMYSDPEAGVTRIAASIGEFLALLTPPANQSSDQGS